MEPIHAVVEWLSWKQSSRSTKRTPKAYVIPMVNIMIKKEALTTTHPHPPSGVFDGRLHASRAMTETAVIFGSEKTLYVKETEHG